MRKFKILFLYTKNGLCLASLTSNQQCYVQWRRKKKKIFFVIIFIWIFWKKQKKHTHLWSGNAANDQYDVLFFHDLINSQISNGDLTRSHMTWHFLSFPNTTWILCTTCETKTKSKYYYFSIPKKCFVFLSWLPVDPGTRCESELPWLATPPENPCRFITPVWQNKTKVVVGLFRCVFFQ